jgi:KipI family sensor histidine kinase inhibitor
LRYPASLAIGGREQSVPRSRSSDVRFLPHGERGLVVELGDAIDPAVNARVRWLARLVRERLARDVLEVVPTYRSLLVVHDPLRVPRKRLTTALSALLSELPAEGEPEQGGRVVHLHACYGGAFGPDLEDVARQAGISPGEAVAIHSSATYLVYMLGFTPGFPYLGGMPARIATPRLATPRTRIPAGSIGIGGEQTGIYPVESPGGWRLIGRTPVRLFDPGRPSPFLLAAGDRIKFVPVGPPEFEDIARRVAGGTYEVSGVQEPRPAAATDGVARRPPPARRAETSAMEVVKPGLLTTVQDEGRPGFRAFGMPVAGALDQHAYAIANLLAGNRPGAAALEMTLLGGTFRFTRDAYVAIAGADMQPTLDGSAVPSWSGFRVRAGSALAFSSARDGVRCYLAVRGGIDVATVLGSRSTYTRAGVGGLQGRPLAAGDVLPSEPVSLRDDAARRLPPHAVPGYGRDLHLRVLLGPQDDRFLPEGVATFLDSAYTVTNRNDRMGYQLEGPVIRHFRGPDIVSDGLLPGAVQVPGSGTPFVMTADCQTVGGYAKIATVIGPDLDRLAQAKRGDVVRFARCTMGEALAALRRKRDQLDAIAKLFP